MTAITRSDAMVRLQRTFEKIQAMGLRRDPKVTGEPKDGGGLKVGGHGFAIDSYTPYKSPEGDAVSLCLLQPKGGDAVAIVHRRQKIDGRLRTVTADEFPLGQYDQAEQFFLATAVMLSSAHHTWRSKHPVDEIGDDS